MRIDYLSSDILLFRGDSLAALATAFVDRKRVLLVDALASGYDAIDMRDYLERDLGLGVDTIVLTHAGQGHDAGLHLFPGAHIEKLDAGSAGLQWGRHRFDLLPAPGDEDPGAEASAPALHAVSDDLLFVGARVVGPVALIGQSSPGDIDAALSRLQQRGAQRIVPAFLGVQDGATLAHARHYLRTLGEHVARVRAEQAGSGVQGAIAAIAIEACLPGGVHAGALERHWHRDNLQRIAERGLFMPQAGMGGLDRDAGRDGQGSATPWRSFVCFIRRTGLVPALTSMLGGLGRSGV